MAMRITLSDGSREYALHVRDGVRLQIAQAADVSPTLDVGTAVRAALNEPLNSPRVEDLVRPGNRVCIICDDITRKTPVPAILAELLPRLAEAGIRREDILIVVALGSHRKMTEAELKAKVGAGVFADYRVLNSEFCDTKNLVQAGNSPLGTPIRLLREALEADVRIGIGSIVPHGCTGWSGGAKILYPGLTAEDIVSEFHALQGLEDQILFGMVECPVRLAIERWAEQIGLDFIINTILTQNMGVYRVVAGHFITAHRAGVAHAHDVYGVSVETAPDVVLISACPLEADFWQCTKALYGAARVAKHGASLILLAPCHEGIGPHPRVTAYAGMADGKKALRQRLAAGETGEDLLAMAVGVNLGKIRATAHIAVVSDGVTEEELVPGSFARFPTAEAQRALDEALDRYTHPTLLVIPAGGEIVPYLSRNILAHGGD